MIVQCKECFDFFEKKLSQINKTKNHFCSRSCAAKFNNKGIQRNPSKERICKSCNITFRLSSTHKSKSHCQSCKMEPVYGSMTLGEYRIRYKGSGPGMYSYLRYLNREWNSHLRSLPCAICNYSKYVELAHIKSLKNLPDSVTIFQANAKENVIQLCPNCHWELDNGILILA